MHNKPETLGCIIKAARENAGITIEALANKVDITEANLNLESIVRIVADF